MQCRVNFYNFKINNVFRGCGFNTDLCVWFGIYRRVFCHTRLHFREIIPVTFRLACFARQKIMVTNENMSEIH